MKYLGIGLGLRPEHYPDVLDKPVKVSWFEAITENYIGIKGLGPGKPLKTLLKVREKFPLVMHGVSMSIGSTDPVDMDYLKKIKELFNVVQPEWISDHLCWTGVGGENLHDLFPLPYTLEALNHLVPRIEKVQDYLGRAILLENVSSYLSYKSSEMTEWDFLREVSEKSGCKILFDVNNIYVSSVNHQFDPEDYLKGIPKESIQQIHLAGHKKYDTHIVDTHDEPVPDPVWALYYKAVERFGKISTMIERDDNIPAYHELESEAMMALKIQEKALGTKKFAEPASASL